jgi:signal transduction histidine kinase
MSIRFKLLAFFGLLATAGLAAFLGLWLYGVPAMGVEGIFSHEYKRSIVSVEALADKERDTFERWFEEHRRELRLLSTSESLASQLEQQALGAPAKVQARCALISRRLNALMEASPGTYRSLTIVEPRTARSLCARNENQINTLLHETGALAEASEPGMTEVVRVVDMPEGPGLLVLSQISQHDLQGNPTGKVLGILVAAFDLGAPLVIDDTSIRQALGDTGAVMLVDARAKVLFNSSRSLTNSDHQFVAQQVVSGTEGARVMKAPQGAELIAVFRHIHLGTSDELSLAVTRPTDDALAAIRASFFRMTGLMVVLFALSMGLVVFASNRIAVAQAEILALNTNLETRIAIRTQELEHSNQHLKDTLQNLQNTRDELVRSEKLAALGALVAGVSHELNTPIGNSLTVASTIDAQVRDFSTAMTKGLTRSALEGFVSEVREGVDILMRSLLRAVELVSSFKQVAVDQTSEHRREFLLRETVNEILMTLGPTMRKTPHTLNCDIPQDIRMQSYPGPLGQVLTNLINNALIHGLKDIPNGTITLLAHTTQPGWVHFSVQDNGAGIAAQHLDRVFDPFFTTRLGQGGSGLGLNIVYNIVTQTLGGTIRVESVHGQGARFILHLPCVAPGLASDSPVAAAV